MSFRTKRSSSGSQSEAALHTELSQLSSSHPESDAVLDTNQLLRSSFYPESEFVLQLDQPQSLSSHSKSEAVSLADQRNNGDVWDEKPLLKPKYARSALSFPVLGVAALDLCLTAASLYFIIFAALAYSNRGVPVTHPIVHALLQAARFGPTIFPILFAALMGKCFTSIAAWRLEHGVKVGTMEFLLGSRTVFNTFTTPIRLRMLRPIVYLLVTLWALSPIGSQASLRAIYAEPRYTNKSSEISYLNSLAPYAANTVSAMDNYQYAITAAFVGALIAPGTSKNASQDPYGNLKIPLLESLTSQEPEGDGWYPTKSADHFLYSSLLGLPVIGIADGGVSYFSTESTYIYPACSLSLRKYSDPPVAKLMQQAELCSSIGEGLWIDIGTTDNGDRFQDDFESNAKSPRQINFISIYRNESSAFNESYVTIATCDLTTTYVETQFRCEGLSCTTTAIRKSTLPHVSSNITIIDGLDILSAKTHSFGMEPSLPTYFCEGFINAGATTPPDHDSAYSVGPLQYYFIDPQFPYAAAAKATFGNPTPQQLSQAYPPLYSIGDKLFSARFAQLLNTYVISGIAPFGVVSNFTRDYDYSELDTSLVSNVTGQIETVETVLRCSIPWLIMLLISAIAMLLGGLTATVLGLLRHGPELIDSFTSMLRDSPYVHVDSGPSTEDGPDRARRIRNTMVVLADIQPGEKSGYIALATEGGERPIQRLRGDRPYL